MNSVLKRIAAEGPLMAKDFENSGKKSGEWGSKPAKRALEYLFMQGELMVPYRLNFHKVYELTERVLPEGTNSSLPNPEEYALFLITRYLQANGLGQPAEIAYLLKNTKALVSATLKALFAKGELVQIRANGNNYYALPSSLELLNKPLARSKLKILSPFYGMGSLLHEWIARLREKNPCCTSIILHWNPGLLKLKLSHKL